MRNSEIHCFKLSPIGIETQSLIRPWPRSSKPVESHEKEAPSRVSPRPQVNGEQVKGVEVFPNRVRNLFWHDLLFLELLALDSQRELVSKVKANLPFTFDVPNTHAHGVKEVRVNKVPARSTVTQAERVKEVVVLCFRPNWMIIRDESCSIASFMFQTTGKSVRRKISFCTYRN